MIQAPVLIEQIGVGDVSVSNTIQKMRAIIRASMKNRFVRETTQRIIRDIPERHTRSEIKAVFEWVKDNTRYTRDPYGLEYIQTPPHILSVIKQEGLAFADCDDMTVLLLSLLRSIGFQTKIKATSYRKDKKYSHVYGLVLVDGLWIPIDCVRKEFKVGYEVPGMTRFTEVSV